MSQQNNNDIKKNFYRASAADFGKIPGRPIAYWLGEMVRDAFSTYPPLREIAIPRQGNTTTNNARFVRSWYEVSRSVIGLCCASAKEFNDGGFKWVPYNKGGGSRGWYGLNESVVNWKDNGAEIKAIPHSVIANESSYFSPGLTWSTISTSRIGFRFFGNGFIFDNKGACIFVSGEIQRKLAALLNSKVFEQVLYQINPTVSLQPGDVAKFPIISDARIDEERVLRISDSCIRITRFDWDAYEVSWDFTSLPLLNFDNCQPNLKATYQKIRANWREMLLEMQRLEEENNSIIIDAYGLQDELTPEVPLSEITLTCNPHYRYGGNLTDEEREARLQSDTLTELISYAIGCMMGRYSLDREGLVYAHAGNEGFKELVEEGAYATFAADEDGILPLTADNWFPDDVAARFEQFVRTVWDAETLEENLQFIADSLCLAAIKPVKKGGETARETIRRYLSTQFFKDHMKTYKKRPIYWLFSSGKEKAFECLVYLHRYNEATLPRMRTEYVTPLLGQMAGRIERLRLQQAEAGTAEAKRIGKEIDTLSKQLTELRAFDDELKHHADMRITLDLDDGVKVNYGKFGNLLSEVKAITGDKGE